MDVLLVFYRQITTFPNNICWRGYHFSIVATISYWACTRFHSSPQQSTVESHYQSILLSIKDEIIQTLGMCDSSLWLWPKWVFMSFPWRVLSADHPGLQLSWSSPWCWKTDLHFPKVPGSCHFPSTTIVHMDQISHNSQRCIYKKIELKLS
jgi:hypothetical protein